jgi:NitT/TauT family transport system permease protein
LEKVNPWLILRVALFYVALLVIWELLYRAEIWSPYLFPSPSEVWEELKKYIDNGLLSESIQDTMRRLFIGFALAFVIGMIMGIACGTMRWVDETLGRWCWGCSRCRALRGSRWLCCGSG